MTTRSTALWATAVVLCGVAQIALAQDPGTCVRAKETELLDLVNDYRESNGRSRVPISTTLITVGQYHVQDAIDNGSAIFVGGCNLHSWSTTMPTLWTGGCYTDDHANANMMYQKPSEISGGSFSALGFENAAQNYATIAIALNAWTNSPGHNNVMLNLSPWDRLTWNSMGVGVVEGAYYYLWFSEGVDTAPALPPCGLSVLFGDGFEDPS